MGMKRIFVTSLILMFCCVSQAAEWKTYFNDDVPANAGSYNNTYTKSGNEYKVWDSRTQTFDTYRNDGEHIYGPSGRYGSLGNGTLYNTSTGDRYYLNGNSVEPLY